MNRKQRRIAESQNKKPALTIGGGSYSIDEAHLLGVQEYQRGNLKSAADILQLIVVHAPDFAEAHNNRGSILQQLGRYEEALASYDKAISLKSGFADAYCNRGVVLNKMKRYEEALASYDKALALNPAHADTYSNRGITLQGMKEYASALASFNQALVLKPNHADACHNRGVTFETMKLFDEAAESFDHAMALNPNIPYLPGAYLHALMHLCDWQRYDEIVKTIAEKIGRGQPASSPFILMPLPLSAALQRTCAEIYTGDKFPPAMPLWKGGRYGHDRIRMGYFSADFHEHATAYLMAGFFELHDRSKFEITAFSYGKPSSDPMRQRMEKAFDHFIDVSAKSDDEIAALARQKEIDIAVDLKGFTTDSRTGIFALRPAPVQTAYMGYPGTMAANYIDYLVADRIIIPEEHRQYYREKIVYLPDTYQATDSTRKISEKLFTREEMGLPRDGFVFCCFNNNYKITPDLFDIWMRLLQKIESSVLWLFEGNATAAKNLRAEAASRGIAENRLIFAKRMNQADHLARQRLADLFLDTFYCNAHTTASDALWAGLPLITWQGDTFAGRVAASLLTAAHLPEMIARSHAEYESLALELATNSQKLAAVRQKLTHHRLTCPLFDTKRLTAHFEEACVNMWERSQAGLAPEHIFIPA